MSDESDQKMTFHRNQLPSLSQGDFSQAKLLEELSNMDFFYSLFKQKGELTDINKALVQARSALELYPPGHPGRAILLAQIANFLHYRFSHFGGSYDLDEALVLARSALVIRPQGDRDQAFALSNLASCLHTRFKHLGRFPDLEEALALERSALELRPEGDPDRTDSLGNIGVYLHTRFTQLGRPTDLDEALALEHDVLKLCPDSGRAESLGKIAVYLLARFRQLGSPTDLDKAITSERNALELRPQGHPHRALSLSNLAVYLSLRSKELGTPSDLREALALLREAIELRPQGDPERPVALSNLASSLHTHFNMPEGPSDLGEALALQRSALELRPQGHPDRPKSLSNIALYLHTRFNQLGELSDLNEALDLERSALELRPQGHPERAKSLSNIASYLFTRFKNSRRLPDLNEALDLERSALGLRPQGHPERAVSLASIANSLHARIEHLGTRDNTDRDEMFNLYSQLSDLFQTVSSADTECAKQWIHRAEEYTHCTTVLAYQTFLRLATHHLVNMPPLPQNLEPLKRLVTSLAVDAFSACLRDHNPTGAVELLEQGRGVFWSQLIRLRSSLVDVVASGDTGKKLAAEFTEVVTSLRTVFDSSRDTQSQHDQACHLNIRLQDIVGHIRELPGLSRFLQPPLFSDLQVAAAGGPVIIINASQYSCDALIILSDRNPIHVPLHITKSRVSELSSELHSVRSQAEYMDVTKDTKAFLRKLWIEIVSPIVDILQQCCPRRSRIWWCPTAGFSLLPLHAAGPYKKGQPAFSNLYISSYTPTLIALIRARQKSPLVPSMEPHHFLLVGQGQAPRHAKLISVDTELTSISQRVGSVATVTRIQDHDASMTSVGEELTKNEFVHLACHGIADRKQPFESGFELSDGRLKVEDIMRQNLQNAKFAYLSACHTTVGDEESPDEVIHLAAAMQFAGFRSVIGTMSAVDDGHTNKITSKFYDNLVDGGHLDHTRAALALHTTLRSLRSSSVPIDQLILYIHIGV